MSLKREQIVDALYKIVGEDQVVTDEQVLKESSVDRFRRFEAYHGVYRLPLPAAVVNVNSSKEVAAVIKFANENKINVVPRTGHSASEGGLDGPVSPFVCKHRPSVFVLCCQRGLSIITPQLAPALRGFPAANGEVPILWKGTRHE